jgi:hypothetical protein
MIFATSRVWERRRHQEKNIETNTEKSDADKKWSGRGGGAPIGVEVRGSLSLLHLQPLQHFRHCDQDEKGVVHPWTMDLW